MLENPYLQCSDCTFVTIDPGEMKKHQEMNHKKNRIQCSYCIFFTQDIDEMKLHQDDCHEAQNALKQKKKSVRLECPQCKFYTEDSRVMNMHRNGAHVAKSPTPKNDGNGEKPSDQKPHAHWKKISAHKFDASGVKCSSEKINTQPTAPKNDLKKPDNGNNTIISTTLKENIEKFHCGHCKMQFTHKNVMKIHEEMAHNRQYLLNVSNNNLIETSNSYNAAEVKEEPNIENNDPLIDPFKTENETLNIKKEPNEIPSTVEPSQTIKTEPEKDFSHLESQVEAHVQSQFKPNNRSQIEPEESSHKELINVPNNERHHKPDQEADQLEADIELSEARVKARKIHTKVCDIPVKARKSPINAHKTPSNPHEVRDKAREILREACIESEVEPDRKEFKNTKKKLRKLRRLLDLDPNANFQQTDENEEDYVEREAKMMITHNHNKRKPYQCKDCPKAFKRRYSLAVHMRSHSPDHRPYPCKYCPKTFLRRDTAKTHMRIHSAYHIEQDTLYRCENCGKGFAQLNNQKRHQLHCANLPFECKLCPYRRRFLLKQSLIRHIKRKHSEVKDDYIENLGETPFFCRKCGRNFASARGLEQHETSKRRACDAIRKLNCDYCGKQFRSTKIRKLHERIHTGINAKSCKFCGKLFSQNSNLRAHIKRHHPEEAKMEMMESKVEIHLREINDKKPFPIEEDTQKSKKRKLEEAMMEMMESKVESNLRKLKDKKTFPIEDDTPKIKKRKPEEIGTTSKNYLFLSSKKKTTKCRFCSLDLHTKSGGMACEHFITCDFTTKSFEEYVQHMSIEHQESVQCEFVNKNKTLC